MKKICNSLLFLALTLLLFSCGNSDDVDCSNVFPPPNWFELGFIDSQVQPLIGSVYQQNEFRIFNSVAEKFISPTDWDPTRLQVRFPDFVSNTQYYIELTTVDIDTLNFVFDTEQGECFLAYDLQQVIYNGETFDIQSNSHSVDLIK